MTPTFSIGLFNAWLLCVPLLSQGVYVALVRKDVAKRMSDMTGYGAKEKLATVAASIAPDPFMALTVWTPFTRMKVLLAVGAACYLLGMGTFFAVVRVFARAPLDEPIVKGPYRFSRNPMYVSAAFTFLGICLVTASPVLLAILAALLLLQHFMILAEERACERCYGDGYVQYTKRVPRYFVVL